MKRICLVGDILVDVTLKSSTNNLKLRLGGVVHAARCLWAMNIPYSVGYFAPSYLDTQIVNYLNSIGCDEIYKLGNVEGTPYVILVNEAKEVADQGYEFLLREEIKINNYDNNLRILREKSFDDYLIISGNFDLVTIVNQLSGNIHIDVANNILSPEVLNKISIKIETIFISTSSSIFKFYYKNDFQSFCMIFQNHTERIILKENRGGSRCFTFNSNSIFSTSSQTQPIVHSIGVGDAFDAVFVSKYLTLTIEQSMNLSSWIASEYAVTTYPDDFKLAVTRILASNISDLMKLGGTSVPWELRRDINIYIAAPDFDYVETSQIDLLCESLSYHNFSPIRPIKKNGQMEINASKSRRSELFTKDLALLDDCSMLIAVLLYDDPGTLIELGIAATKGIPTIVFDPFRKASNCMLTELPRIVSHDLDEIISEVFIISSNITNHAK